MSFGTLLADGHLDDQDQVMWSTGKMDIYDTSLVTGTASYGPFNVSNWNNVFWRQRCTTPNVQFNINTLWAGPGGTPIFAGRQFTYDSGMPDAFEINLRNLGPTLLVTIVPNTPATVWQNSAVMILNNRTTPFVSMPDGQLIEQRNWNLGANQTITQLMTAVAGARSAWYLTAGTQGLNFEIDILTYNLVYLPIYTLTLAANATSYFEVILPMNACQYKVTNPTANASTGTAAIMWLATPGA